MPLDQNHSVDWDLESQCMHTIFVQSKHLNFAIVAGGNNSEVDGVKADRFHAITTVKHLGIRALGESILKCNRQVFGSPA